MLTMLLTEAQLPGLQDC